MSSINPARGRFITFEGIDGAGKSSHVDWFADRLRAAGHTVLVSREPGGPELSERLRDLLLHQPMNPVTESLLAFAARNEHLQQRIVPALSAGTWVVCDRFTDSTFAYQGAGRGVDWAALSELERWVQQGLQPDRTFLFDLPAAEAARRRAAVRAADRFEAEDLAFFERVRDGYQRRAMQTPHRFCRIDSSSSIEDIRLLLDKEIATIC